MSEQDMETKEMKLVVFQLGKEEYGVDVNQVRSIERMGPITRVPNTADFVKGVMNLRGVVTSIIDLRSRFQFEEAKYTDRTRIVIVSVEDIDIGLIVDAATDVLNVSEKDIEPPPEIVGGIEAAYLHGVAKLEERLLILLNLNKVLSKEEIQVVKQVQEIV